MILLLVRVARHHEADYYTAHLAALGDSRVATTAELRVLSQGHLRANARRYAHARAGGRGRQAVRRLQRAQSRLALALSRGEPGEAWREAALVERARLVAINHPEGVAGVGGNGILRRTVVALGSGVLLLMTVWVAIRAIGAA